MVHLDFDFKEETQKDRKKNEKNKSIYLVVQ